MTIRLIRVCNWGSARAGTKRSSVPCCGATGPAWWYRNRGQSPRGQNKVLTPWDLTQVRQALKVVGLTNRVEELFALGLVQQGFANYFAGEDAALAALACDSEGVANVTK